MAQDDYEDEGQAMQDASAIGPLQGCPRCGERRQDELAWQDDETVRCVSCGNVYRPE